MASAGPRPSAAWTPRKAEMEHTVEDRVRKVVAEVFGLPLDSITAQTSHDDIEDWDSVNVLNLLMAVESEFETTLSPEDVADFLSVELVTAVLSEKGIT